MIFACSSELRRAAVRGHPTLNGIDFLEVRDGPGVAEAERQRTLFVHFLKPLDPAALGLPNVRVEGGERVRGVAVTSLEVGTGPGAHVLTVRLDHPGDFSTYLLRLVRAPGDPRPPDRFDPQLAAVSFSFKAACPTDFDCPVEPACPPAFSPPPEISYLAKDYASFRQLMLDRLSALMPGWTERNPADLGIALVELLAYVADYLSYEQDAVATEAYLGTARRRVSVRRHARLVDYAMHDGCNARVWLAVDAAADTRLPAGTPVLTSVPGAPSRLPSDPATLARALASGPQVFATMQPALLTPAHRTLSFYTWGERACCLPRGATRATFQDSSEPSRRLRLRRGDVLLLEERLGPRTGLEADADRAHRHPVRLTWVDPEAVPTLEGGVEVGRTAAAPRTDPLTGQPIVEAGWDPMDALPFPLCVSAAGDRGDLADVSVARGNIVLADHGQWVGQEALGDATARFRPRLREAPLTFAAPLDAAAPATSALVQDAGAARPTLRVTSTLGARSRDWSAARDLLGSQPEDAALVAEVEEDGTAFLRFGDGRHGLRPEPGAAFTARYRVGNGAAGNVGAEALVHVVADDPAVLGVRNLLPARGGIDPEGSADARQRAPFAFRTQERAVTAADYAEVALRHPAVQRAAATFRWTGSWRTVFVAAERAGGQAADPRLRQALLGHLERYRLAGQDVDVDSARFVPLEVELRVCVRPDYARRDLQRALLDLFSNRVLPDGRRGLFHPDRFGFGQPVFLSPLLAAAQSVEGVDSAQVTCFGRLGRCDPTAVAAGRLDVGPLEIARLDNDRGAPERGVFRLRLEGGR